MKFWLLVKPLGWTAVLLGSWYAIGAAVAGAWVQEPGSGQVITQFVRYEASGGFDDRGLPIGNTNFVRSEISFYTEYGLTEDWTIGWQPRLQQIDIERPPDEEAGFGSGDWDFFARRRLMQDGRWAASAQVLVKIPDGYSSSSEPLPGDGAMAFEGRLAAGRSIGQSWLGSGYVNLESAYRKRSGGFADEVRVDGSVGWSLRKSRIMTIVELHNTFSTGGGKGAYDVSRLQITAVRPLGDRLKLQAGGTTELAGSNIALGEGLIFGLWLQF